MSSSDVPYDDGDSDEIERVDLPLNVVALEGIGRRDRYGPLLIVILMGSIGLGLMLVDFRLGTLVMAAAAFTALILRAVLPTRRAGLLVVRTRTIELVTLAVIAGSLVVLALITPAQ